MKANPVFVTCFTCGVLVRKTPSTLRQHNFCSGRCRGRYRATFVRERASQWKGGRTLTHHGYVRVKIDRAHPMATSDGYILEHRLVLATHLGRMLSKDEIVHHINGVKTDNRLENLELFESSAAHRRYHGVDYPKLTCWCGAKHDARGMCSRHYKLWARQQVKRRGS